jgi:hypothetical protein
MSFSPVLFIAILVIFFSIFAYLGAKDGISRSFSSFLRIFIPMLLSGVIVWIAHHIPKSVELISYIIGGIGAVIFFLVLRSAIKLPERRKDMNIAEYFFGLMIGIARGWLICGFVLLYLDFLDKYFNVIKLRSFVNQPLLDAIIIPVKWVLFLDFIRF